MEIETGSRVLRNQFAEEQTLMQSSLKRQFRAMGIDSIYLRTDEEYSTALARFFKNREKRARHG